MSKREGSGLLFTGLALALSVVVYVMLDSEDEPVAVRAKPSKRLKEGPVQVSPGLHGLLSALEALRS